MTTTTPTVRIKASAQEGQFVAFVHTDTEEVRVRFKRLPPTGTRTYQWTCGEHGQHLFATCTHERAALSAWRARKVEAND